MRWTVRRGAPADAARVAAISVDGWRAAYRGLIDDDYLDSLRAGDRVDRLALRLMAPDPDATLLAIAEDGTIGAYASLAAARVESGPVGELAALYADPRWLGTGAGYAVHQAGLAHLAAQGFRHAVVWVFRDNAPSRRFYEARGWRCDGVTKDLAVGGAPTPEVRYSRLLSQLSRT